MLLSSVTLAFAQLTFTSIDYPGGFGTSVRGINNHGQMVGAYIDQDGNAHALLIQKGKFIPLAPDTAIGLYSEAYKINVRGDIVGRFCDDVACHGFLLSNKGVLTILDFPGATFTYGFGINESGTVVGVWDLLDANYNLLYEGGFIWKDGTFTEVKFPGAADSAATAINARGDYLGSWDRGLFTWTSGFVFSKGEFTSFDAFFPELTQPTGINAHGDIIGQWYENGIPHGFLKLGADFIKIEYPDAVWTTSWDINSAGQMVGNWADSAGTVHGWLAQPDKKRKP